MVVIISLLPIVAQQLLRSRDFTVLLLPWNGEQENTNTVWFYKKFFRCFRFFFQYQGYLVY